jgi:hypothetical protein
MEQIEIIATEVDMADLGPVGKLTCKADLAQDMVIVLVMLSRLAGV